MSRFVLVVDDDELARILMLKYLDKGGYKAEAVASGDEALSYIKKNNHQIDLVLADLMLDDMSGLELFKSVRKINPSIEFIIITGQTSVNSIIDAIRIGAADYVFKPINGEDLMFRVKSVFDKIDLKNKLVNVEKELMYQATITTANHEINQPLTVIISGIDILKMELSRIDCLNPHIENYLELIYKSSQRIANILKKFRQIRTPVVKDVPRGMKLIELDSDLEKKILPNVKILVIEDEVNVKDVIVKILKKYQLQVFSVENGLKAIKAVKEEKFDLILMDMNLPDLSDEELFDQLLKISAESKIMLMTGYAGDVEIKHLMDKGAVDFILKPFDANSLYSKIWNIFKRLT